MFLYRYYIIVYPTIFTLLILGINNIVTISSLYRRLESIDFILIV